MQAKHPALAAPEDAAWLAQWGRHRLPLHRAGSLRLWSERLILAGEERFRQISQQVDQADLIVVLLSADCFMPDDWMDIGERAIVRQLCEQVTPGPWLLRPSTRQDSALRSLHGITCSIGRATPYP